MEEEEEEEEEEELKFKWEVSYGVMVLGGVVVLLVIMSHVTLFYSSSVFLIMKLTPLFLLHLFSNSCIPS